MPFPENSKLRKSSDKKDSKDPLADLPDWIKDFKENLKETELHASARSSPESDLEYPTTVAKKSRKHSIFTHFPKDRDCDVCLGTKVTEASCRRRTGDALLSAEKFGDLVTADGQADGVLKAGATGGGGLARVPNLRVQTPSLSGGTRRERRVNERPAVVLSSRRGKYLQ